MTSSGFRLLVILFQAKNYLGAPDPTDWYNSKCWVFVFDPRCQNKELLGDFIGSGCNCLWCGQKGHVGSKEHDWRLCFHWFHMEVLCLHPRLRCKQCGGSSGMCIEVNSGRKVIPARDTFAKIKAESIQKDRAERTSQREAQSSKASTEHYIQ